ncbi:hypothetical protein SY212_01000 [Ligilactobacillus agilis]|uniref:hypothetical protein n=1 Tax=Ligilactobacillus agilis TaxID=1601 RepID=UPI000B8D4CBC|nr:hypothetical protein [Ligilactobacillus agilis]ASR40686.1 hypothetical protein BEN83_03920 [Ligilactobacillus agilis]GET05070.1 hypothetical protein SY212_01000 [Ligilactobacillus agilis]
MATTPNYDKYYKKYKNYGLRLNTERAVDQQMIDFIEKGKAEMGLNNFFRKIISEYMRVHDGKVDAFVSLENRLRNLEVVTLKAKGESENDH